MEKRSFHFNYEVMAMQRRLQQKSPLCEDEERIATAIVQAAYQVHSKLGPGLLENIYEVCFCHELEKAGFATQRQVTVPLIYDGIQFEEGLRLDLLVENQVICELKAVEVRNPVYVAQLLSQMRLTGKRLGFLINFNVDVIRNGIDRFVR